MRFLARIAILAPIGLPGLLATTAGASDLVRSDRLSIMQDDTLGLDCVAEATAFTEVADLAYIYRENGEIFAGALFDLREQLLDCLATSSESREHLVMPSSRDMKSI